MWNEHFRLIAGALPECNSVSDTFTVNKSFTALPLQGFFIHLSESQGGAALCPGLSCFGPSGLKKDSPRLRLPN